MKPKWLEDRERHRTWMRCVNCAYAGGPYKSYSGGRVLYTCTKHPAVKFTINEYACEDYKRRQ